MEEAQTKQLEGLITKTADNKMAICQPTPFPPVIVQPAPMKTGGRVEKYQCRQSIGLGTTLIIFGVASIVLNGVGFALSDKIAHVSHGFYCGAMFILTGSIGIAAARKNKCLIITFMVLAIITAIMTIEMLIVGLIGSVHNSKNCGEDYFGYCTCTEEYYEGYGYRILCATYYTPPCSKGAIATEAVLAILAFLAAIVSIWSSAICCRAVCCCRSKLPAYGAVFPVNLGNKHVMAFSHQQASANCAYGSEQHQSITGYFNYDPVTQQYQYWTSPPQFSYPIGVQAAPESVAVGVTMAPPGYAETLANGPPAEVKKM